MTDIVPEENRGGGAKIRKTCPWKGYPFCIEKKTEVCRGISIFLIFAPKHRLRVRV